MSRKKLIKNRLKDLKKKAPSKKRLKLKHEKSDISNLFESKKTLYYSGYALTDNFTIMLLNVNKEFLEKNSLTNKLKEFNLNENDLQIKFDTQKELRPTQLEDAYAFDEIGLINKDILNWFSMKHPKCALHKITEWFGKAVNTLIIVLDDHHGKPVAIVKTYN